VGDETFKVSLQSVIVCSETFMQLLALLGRQVGLGILLNLTWEGVHDLYWACIIEAASLLPFVCSKM
jgi:hypothetical protein